MLQSKKDNIVSPVSANIVYREVSSKHREIHWFEKSGHEMGQDMEREAVFERVMGFVGKFRKAPERLAKAKAAPKARTRTRTKAKS